MYEEQRLIAIGFPLEDALTVCHSMRRCGLLDEFMVEIDRETRPSDIENVSANE